MPKKLRDAVALERGIILAALVVHERGGVSVQPIVRELMMAAEYTELNPSSVDVVEQDFLRQWQQKARQERQANLRRERNRKARARRAARQA